MQVLIDFLWFNVVYTTPACFNTFCQSTMVPTLVENSLVHLFVNFFWKHYDDYDWKWCRGGSREFKGSMEPLFASDRP